jgi:hypothetical protein
MRIEDAWKLIGLSCVAAMFVSEKYTFFDTWLIVFSIGMAAWVALVMLNAFWEAD